MKNNDLSNRGAPCILVRVEDCLVEYKTKTVTNKLSNFIFGKEFNSTFNEEVLWLLVFILKNTDLTVDLVVDRKNINNDLRDLLEEVPHGRLLIIDKPVQISTKLNTGEYLYYVDTNLERISLVSNKRTISPKQLEIFIRGGFKFE